MSKRGYISRYMLIIKKLKSAPYSTFEEIRDYIGNNLEHMQMMDDTLVMGDSIRTFQRDIREIRNMFGIDIAYCRSQKGYYLSQTEMENMNFQRMMEAFDMFNSLNLAKDLQPYVHLEKRRAQGTENILGLLHAIRNRKRITFTYHKFWDESTSMRSTDPYALKEFKNRWYVIAKDKADGNVKSFALDRLSDLEITGEVFDYPRGFDIEEKYRHFFGIISPFNQKPEKVVLSFEPLQGRYIKSQPLHHSQKVLKDTDKELRIQLNICITYDFIQELLSHGDRVRVVEPEGLVDEVRRVYASALRNYPN